MRNKVNSLKGNVNVKIKDKSCFQIFKTVVLTPLFAICILLQVPITYALASDASQLQKIETMIQQNLPNANIGILLQDAKSGKVIYERRSNENYLPASTTKILTAVAALFSLGPDYQYETTLRIPNDAHKQNTLTGDIYLQFTGDPSLTTADLQTLIKEIKSKGIAEIKGDIVIDNTRFQGPNYALGWTWNSLPWYYSAPVTSIILNENKVKLNLTPNKTLGEKANLTLAEDEQSRLNITHDIVSVSESEANERCQIMLDINSQNEVTAYGCWPAKETADSLKISIQNPTLLARQVITDTLKKENIKLTGQVALGSAPKETKTLSVHRSKPLSELLKVVLQDSNNIYSDSITKTLGVQRFQQGTFQAGVLAIQEILAKNLGLDATAVRVKDGSGLSRYNAISPNYFGRLLYGMYHNKQYSKLFRESLGLAGEWGTLENRLTSFDLSRQVQAKTGSLMGTSSLAGYITTRDKQDLIFVIMINNAVQDSKKLKNFENGLCEIFASL